MGLQAHNRDFLFSLDSISMFTLQRFGGTGGAAVNDSHEPSQPSAPVQDKKEWEVCKKS